MIAVLIPAHNEEALIAQCLRSVELAAQSPALRGEAVTVIVALDGCTDGTEAIATRFGATLVHTAGGNVGAARAAAAERALALGARWLANTDADTRVPPDWLSAQLADGADAFCGIVTVDDWSDYCVGMAAAFVGAGTPHDGHPHVHGANLGISAAAYRACGGYAPLRCSEDVALIDAVVASGGTVARRARPCVHTSARRHARARGGFSDYLQTLERRLLGAGQPA